MPSSKLLTFIVPVILCGCVTGLDRHKVGVESTVADRTRPDPHHRETGLYAAIRAGNVDRVRLILKVHPTLLDEYESRTKRPLTPLQTATDHGQLGVMELLVSLGADLEGGRDSGEGTPLRMAARDGLLDAAELLLAHGAQLDLYSAVALNKRSEVERLLRVASAFGGARHLASSRWKEPGGLDTPLVCLAGDRGHTEIVQLLVRYGADPKAVAVRSGPFISDNNFKGATIGLTPAGTLTYDLDVPVRKP